jgi:hypothetical protein
VRIAYACTVVRADKRMQCPRHRRRMKRYANLAGDSGVTAYESRATSIVVQFQDGWKYEYTRHSVGAAVVETMKQLAAAGRGLSSFISQEVRDGYARKFR